MIFENESVTFHILDVLELNQENINANNLGRNFSALSFRLHADTVLKSETEEYRVQDNSVSFVPARLDYSRISKYDRLIVVHFDVADYRGQGIECFTPAHPEKLKALFEKILTCWEKKEIGYRHDCSAVLYEIFAECYRQNYKQKAERSKIQKSVEYIHNHYTDAKLSIDAVAGQSYMSEVYFRKLFKAEFGTSPQKYIVRLRIQNAVALISTGYYSLKEVAALSGYTDYKYFSVEFKKQTGVSPSAYVYNFDTDLQAAK